MCRLAGSGFSKRIVGRVTLVSKGCQEEKLFVYHLLVLFGVYSRIFMWQPEASFKT
jgi:hypothetical protein